MADFKPERFNWRTETDGIAARAFHAFVAKEKPQFAGD